MSDTELLNALKSEMLLATARSAGATKAYELAAISDAEKQTGLRQGWVVDITFSDGVRRAMIDKIIYEWWGEQPGPRFYGRLVLKSEKRLEKSGRLLFSLANWQCGAVKKVPRQALVDAQTKA